MTEYYKDRLKQGLKYQDFIMNLFADELGIIISIYTSREYQLVGESMQGIEIKHDDQYAKTDNLYIEYAEKSNKDNREYIGSSILRKDNTWLWVIGNYKRVFIFAKKLLKRLYVGRDALKYQIVETETSRGYLLPHKDAVKYAAKIIEVSGKEAYY